MSQSNHPDRPPKLSSRGEVVPGVLQRLRLGRAAAVCAGIEVSAVVASLITGDPAYAEVGPVFDAVIIGGALFGAHEYYVNGRSKDQQPVQSLIKDK